MKVWLTSVCGPLSLLSSQLINIWIFIKYFVTQTLILHYVLSCLQKKTPICQELHLPQWENYDAI